LTDWTFIGTAKHMTTTCYFIGFTQSNYNHSQQIRSK
jgi:hypothetical protein